MSVQINCVEHGNRAAVAACVHIVQTLKDRVPRGFLPLLEEDGSHSAICTVCNEMPFDEWEKTHFDNLAVICFECYRRAAEINEAMIPEVMQ